jgi:hypothetical protein
VLLISFICMIVMYFRNYQLVIGCNKYVLTPEVLEVKMVETAVHFEVNFLL